MTYPFESENYEQESVENLQHAEAIERAKVDKTMAEFRENVFKASFEAQNKEREDRIKKESDPEYKKLMEEEMLRRKEKFENDKREMLFPGETMEDLELMLKERESKRKEQEVKKLVEIFGEESIEKLTKLVELQGTSSTEELENIFTDLEGKDNDRK